MSPRPHARPAWYAWIACGAGAVVGYFLVKFFALTGPERVGLALLEEGLVSLRDLSIDEEGGRLLLKIIGGTGIGGLLGVLVYQLAIAETEPRQDDEQDPNAETGEA